MSRILLAGHAPFDETATRRYAGQLRTLQFLQALRAAGHDVLVVGGRIPETFSGARSAEAREADVLGAEVRSVAPHLMEAGVVMRKAISDFRPAALVGAGTWASACACIASSGDDAGAAQLPVWADLHGDAFAEAQAKAVAADDDSFIASYAWRAWTCFERADAFSSVSRRQRIAALGQISLAGRHARATFGHTLVHVIPSAPEVLPAPAGSPLRGNIAPADAVIILWPGGWNNWADVDACFEGVELAMSNDARIHFIATGGAIAGHEENRYDRFARIVESSAHRARYHLLGWISPADMSRAIDDADVALVVDLPCLETELGCRTRALTVMLRGLPIIATRGAELLIDAEEAGGAVLVDPRDPEKLGRMIIDCARDTDRRRRMSAAARSFAEARTPSNTAGPLVDWASTPLRAPDAGMARPRLKELTRFGVEGSWSRFLRAVRQDGLIRACRRAMRHIGLQ